MVGHTASRTNGRSTKRRYRSPLHILVRPDGCQVNPVVGPSVLARGSRSILNRHSRRVLHRSRSGGCGGHTWRTHHIQHSRCRPPTHMNYEALRTISCCPKTGRISCAARVTRRRNHTNGTAPRGMKNAATDSAVVRRHCRLPALASSRQRRGKQINYKLADRARGNTQL